MGEKVTVTLDGHELASFVTRAIQDRRIVVDLGAIVGNRERIMGEKVIVEKEDNELIRLIQVMERAGYRVTGIVEKDIYPRFIEITVQNKSDVKVVL